MAHPLLVIIWKSIIDPWYTHVEALLFAESSRCLTFPSFSTINDSIGLSSTVVGMNKSLFSRLRGGCADRSRKEDLDLQRHIVQIKENNRLGCQVMRVANETEQKNKLSSSHKFPVNKLRFASTVCLISSSLVTKLLASRRKRREQSVLLLQAGRVIK